MQGEEREKQMTLMSLVNASYAYIAYFLRLLSETRIS